MGLRIHTMTTALALGVLLGACNQPANTQQAPADGGYGPFGGEQNAPAPVAGPTGGVETVISGAGGDAHAQAQSLITTYLDRYTGQIAAGWVRVPSVGDTITGLSLGGEHRLQVSLRASQAYAFIGACDNECDNVDLILEDASGSQVDSDVLADDYPLVEVTPPADAIYTLRIQLKTCTIAPCFVGARLVRQP